MRPEKNYLLREVEQHLGKSSYVFVTDFSRLTVAETADLRGALRPLGAEFHVVKNTLLRVAMAQRELPEMDETLKGPTAMVTGGKNVSEVAKALVQFAKAKDKIAVKGGILDGRLMSSADVNFLSTLPSMEVMRGQFLGLLNAPAQQFVRVLQAVPESVLNVLQAHVKANAEA
jgi:large subunit ribosomal protein L10